MKLSEFYAPGRVVVSYELFPPKTETGMGTLFEHLKEMVLCGPSFITCTYGAGGSTRNKTLEVLRRIRARYPHIPLATHLTCVGNTVDQLREYLQEAQDEGLEGVVALRGDPPRGETDFRPVAGGLRYANELVALIRSEFPDFSIMVAGYPETHVEAACPETDLENLKRKVDAGGEVVLTQMFYHNEDFFRFRDRCDKAGIDVPIVPGVFPVTNLNQIQKITSLCGAQLTPRLVERLEYHGDDAEGQFSVGVYYAARQVEELVEQGAPGVHFYVLNKSRAVALICRALALSGARHCELPQASAQRGAAAI